MSLFIQGELHGGTHTLLINHYDEDNKLTFKLQILLREFVFLTNLKN